MDESTDQMIPVNKFTVAFYNTENLFEVIDDKNIHDNDLVNSRRWTRKRYEKKLKKLGYVISNIGLLETGRPPALIGLAEVENASVLNDLIHSKYVEAFPYSFVHFDSKDERGIDVALVYDQSIFRVQDKQTFSLELFDDVGSPDFTRDILLISGILHNQVIHIIINHWSSRREGYKETEHKRMEGSDKVAEIISSLKLNDENARILVIGDFNDGPKNKSVNRLVTGFDLYNAVEPSYSYKRGSNRYDGRWNLFDQILITKNFLITEQNELQFASANIFDDDFLRQHKGKYKGTPFRTFSGKKYKGGYSDHFPVYTVLTAFKSLDK